MKIVEGILDYSKPWSLPDVYLFTGNNVVKNDGAVVMGRGAAKQCRDIYPGIDVAIGNMIRSYPLSPVVWVMINPKQCLGWFQVKKDWQAPAELPLIARSVKALSEVADNHPENTFHMNYPGIGNGKLNQQMVEPLVINLPDNVVLYRVGVKNGY